METIALKVQKRTADTPAFKVRQEGLIPAICYGAGKENMEVVMPYQDFRKAYIKAGENTLIDLDVDGTKHKVLVHEVQMDPLYSTIMHVDFHLVNMKEKVDTHVPVTITGTSPAVKDHSGVLNVALDEIEVRCLPSDIPHEFVVDISVIEDFHTAIHVSDLKAPQGVEIMNDPELTVVSVMAPTVQEEVELSPEEAEKAAIAAAAGAEPERDNVSTKEPKKDNN